jgi:regulator of protease activity HflC (stomatin/prohibitin superfamily)
MQDAQPPEPVQAAFSDAVKAREDKQRLINEAQTYANGIYLSITENISNTAILFDLL